MEEQYERVPWSTLERRERSTRWTWYLGGVVVLAGVAAAFAVLFVANAAAPDVAALDVASGTRSDAPAPSTVAPQAVVEAPVTTFASSFSTPSAYSEADLMALVPTTTDLLIRTTAEAFVHEYFSGDVRLDEFPDRPTASSGHVSYVEWVRAYDVGAAESAESSVRLVMQMVVGPAAGPFTRMPVRAVEVRVRVQGAEAAPVGLPVLVERAPIGLRIPLDRMLPTQDLPDEIVAEAESAARTWGAPTVIGGKATSTGWTVVVEIASTVEGRWTVAVDVASPNG